MTPVQNFLHALEVGPGRVLARLVPLVVTLIAIVGALHYWVYKGLPDAQSMDNAQLARQILRGEGFTTEFLRPYAVNQLLEFHKTKKGTSELFPADKFPPGTPRVLPDTYNSPAYPYLLAGWLKMTGTKFEATPAQLAQRRGYMADQFIPLLNHLLLILTSLLVAAMGYRFFDPRVAWIAPLVFLSSALVWSYSLSGHSTMLLMFLVTGFFFFMVELYATGESCFKSDEADFWPAWLWALAAALVLGLVCLTRLNFVVLLIPSLIFLGLVPRTNLLLLPVFTLVLAGIVGPWFWHMHTISGSPIGSNAPLILSGEDDYNGNEVYCRTSFPSYERVFKDVSKKEYLGFRWHFEHVWELLGSNLMVVFFAASLLHPFRRARVQALRWMLVGCAILIVAANSLGDAQPAPVDGSNSLIALLPCLIVVGTAYFFILLDRINIPIAVVNNAIITLVVVLGAVPLALNIMLAPPKFYNYPPYMPPYINLVTRLVHPDEWATSDMPWATAWYGDRPSLWLPDSIADFEDLNDNVCPSGMLMFTPLTLGAPVMNLTTGEYKAWYSIVLTGVSPPNFPLPAHTILPAGGPEYQLWSDTARWK